MPTNAEPALATSIRTTGDALIVVLESREVTIPWEECSARLVTATAEQRRHADLSPSGYGIHWPLVDEDLTIAGLLRRAAEGERAPRP